MLDEVRPRAVRARDEEATQGSVRLVDADEAFELFPPVYERVRATRAGMLSRDERWWKEHRLADPESWRRGASRKFYAAVELDGAVEGYAYYRIKDEWEDGFPRGEVRVIEAFATSAAGRAGALALPARDRPDHPRRRVQTFDPASPLPLLVRDPRALGLRLGDGLWLRLVDVDAALQARSYKPGESVVLEVRDELCPWNAGRYRVGDDAGRTDDTADLALDVTDLASAYLGGVRLPPARARRPRRRARRGRRRGGVAALPHRPAALTARRCSEWPGTSARPRISRSSRTPSARSRTTSAAARTTSAPSGSRRVLPLERMHAAFDGDADRRRRGRVPVPADRAGRGRAAAAA